MLAIAAAKNPAKRVIALTGRIRKARAESPYPAASAVVRVLIAAASPTITMAVASERPTKPQAR
jgi:hypothetical protein